MGVPSVLFLMLPATSGMVVTATPLVPVNLPQRWVGLVTRVEFLPWKSAEAEGAAHKHLLHWISAVAQADAFVIHEIPHFLF